MLGPELAKRYGETGDEGLAVKPIGVHVGTADVDLALHAEALGDGEYARLVDMLRSHGYRQSPNLRRFQLARTLAANASGPSIEVIVDFLMPREAIIAKKQSALVDDFAVQRADGAELALKFYKMVPVEGGMPDGGRNRVSIAVADIPALLAMKGYAIAKPKGQRRLRHLLLRAQLPRRRQSTGHRHDGLP